MKITSRYNSARVLWESPCSTMRATVIKAISESADLCGANLRGANLCDANLCDANLRDADLCGTDLRGTDLCDANLCDADLCDADLCDANLRGADLRGANLRGANLCDANLRGANLRDANLRDANLRDVRADFLSEVLKLPNELEFLRDALLAGKVNGSTYSGVCACLAGTLAHARGITDYQGGTIKNGCEFLADSLSPRERFFLAIKEGDTPENNSVCKIALDWTNEAISMRDNIRTHAMAKQ